MTTETATNLLNACKAVLAESERVVANCLRGHSQHAEEFAYDLAENDRFDLRNLIGTAEAENETE